MNRTAEYIQALRSSKHLGLQVTAHNYIAPQPGDLKQYPRIFTGSAAKDIRRRHW